MEHIIQFGISLDDSKIENLVMEKATKEWQEQIRKNMKSFTEGSYYSDSQLKQMFKEEVKKAVDEQRATIIQEVIKQVSVNIMKTKDMLAAKSKLVDMMGGIDGN